ncbi:hypothetical protein SLS58_007835, partial [Diplodia intermedia]
MPELLLDAVGCSFLFAFPQDSFKFPKGSSASEDAILGNFNGFGTHRALVFQERRQYLEQPLQAKHMLKSLTHFFILFL